VNDLVIDLCCGLGRFPSNNVVSIDIQRKVKPTIIADIRYLPLKKGLKPKLVHASPPCTYLSLARARQWGYHEKGIAESLRLVAACFDAFYYLEPEMWTLENPVGVLKRIVPTDIKTNYKAADYDKKPTNFWTNNRGLKRAIIPKDVRQKILTVAGLECEKEILSFAVELTKQGEKQ
jgi:site-specific DNA-cytosine methylase